MSYNVEYEMAHWLEYRTIEKRMQDYNMLVAGDARRGQRGTHCLPYVFWIKEGLFRRVKKVPELDHNYKELKWQVCRMQEVFKLTHALSLEAGKIRSFSFTQRLGISLIECGWGYLAKWCCYE